MLKPRTLVLFVAGLLCCLSVWGGKPPKDPPPPFTNPAFVCDMTSSKRCDTEVHLISSDGSRIEQLICEPDGLGKHSSIFSPDGNTIAYLKTRIRGYAATDLYVMHRLEDHTWSDPVLVREDFAGGGPLDWSPDGSKILTGMQRGMTFLDMTVPYPVPEVISLPTYMGHRTPNFSPDLDLEAPGYQGRIVFEVVDDTLGVYDLFILEDVEFTAGSSVQYGVETQLTFTVATEREVSPAWSPDGTEIAYKEWNGNCIKVINPETFATRVLYCSELKVESGPTWSPDGIYIAFLGKREGPTKGKKTAIYTDIFRIRADGSDLIRVTDGGLSLRSARWNPAWENDL